MRETYTDKQGTERFKPNMIVCMLLELCSNVDINTIWKMANRGLFSPADIKEFYQMINYSVSGYDEIFGEEGHEGENWG